MTSTNTPYLASRQAAFAALLLTLLAGCGQAPNASESKNDDTAEVTVIPVEIAKARRGDIYAAYAGTAALEAFTEATVVAKVDGEIASIRVEEGDVVKSGDVLARLDGDRLRLRLNQARSNLAKTERDYNRNVDLHNKGLVASGAFEALKFDVDALRAAYNIAKLELDYSTIKAPIDGVIVERMIKAGNTISINTPMFQLVDLSPLIAYLYVPEREFGKLHAGQRVAVSVDALPQSLFEGVVARISPMVDSTSGTFKVTIELDPSDTELKPGMFARLSIIFDSRLDALLVPREAIIETELGSTVFIVTDGVARRHGVKTGYSWQNDIEIIDGVKTGDSIVVIGQATLKDGAEVDVIDLTQTVSTDDAESETE